MSAIIPRLLKYQFRLLCLAVLVVMGLHARNGQWVGDFWEHSAVVRELATHPLHPQHPQLLLDAPHPFYSPYSLGVALLARTLGLHAVDALAIMGMVNVTLLLVGLRLLVEALDVSRPEETAFYLLLLTLFWWGTDVWVFSGFFHIGALRYVLPYPSTFAAAVTFVAIWMNRCRLVTGRHVWLVPIGIVAIVVLLSHPITFVFLGVALIAQACGQRSHMPARLAVGAGVLGAAFALALFWPYFPVWAFFTREAGVFNDSNADMYQLVLTRIWPALIAVPFLVANLRRDWRRPLALIPMLLLGIYAGAGLVGAHNYGRLIAYIVLFLHLTLAERLALWGRIQSFVLPAAVLIAAIALSWRPLGSTLKYAVLRHPRVDEPYQFLAACTGQYDVVLADVATSWMVPTFGGKIVAADNTLAFVPDHEARRADLTRFFSKDASAEERQAIVQKYDARYLLLPKADLGKWKTWQPSVAPGGRVVCENDSFLLTSLETR